jgi:hypothetical protein
MIFLNKFKLIFKFMDLVFFNNYIIKNVFISKINTF